MTSTLLTTAFNAAEDKMALDIVVLNMETVSVMADQLIICHANSERQVKAIAKEVSDKAAEAGFTMRRVEGFDTGRWVLVDLGDVIVHVFHKDERNHYNLEKLWGDAPLLDLAEEE